MKHRIVLITCLIALLSACASLAQAASLDDVKSAILNKDYAGAQAACEEFLTQTPPGTNTEEAIYYLALSQLYLGENETARGNFQKIVDGTQDKDLYDQASVGVINSYYLAGDHKEALQRAEALLKERPDSNFLSLIHLKIARANLRLRNWRTARHSLRTILNEFPDSLEAHTAKQLLEEKRFFTVQVGAFLDQTRAQNLVLTLKENGEYGYIVETVDKEGKTFYRVRVGELSSLGEAETLRSKLAQYGYPTLIYP